MQTEQDSVSLEPLFSPKMRELRNSVLKQLLPALVTMNIVLFIICCFFFGSGYKPYTQLGQLDIWVVDFDNGDIAQAFEAYVNTTPIVITFWNETHQNFIFVDGWSRFPNGPQQVQDAVSAGDDNIWGAIIINIDASTNLQAAQTSTTPVAYDPKTAFTLVYDEGRGPSFIPSFVTGAMRTAMAQFMAVFQVHTFAAFLKQLDINKTTTAATANPESFGLPVSYNELNLHPILTNTATISATNVALIFTFIMSMNSATPLLTSVKPHHVVCIPQALLLGIVISVNVAIFHSTYVLGWGLYMLLQWMLILGLMYFITFINLSIPIPNVAMIIIGLFLAINVASGEFFYPLAMSDPFYNYGYFFPFHSAVQAARTILSGSYNRLYQDLPILGAWVVGTAIMICIFSFLNAKQRAAQAAKKDIPL